MRSASTPLPLGPAFQRAVNVPGVASWLELGLGLGLGNLTLTLAPGQGGGVLRCISQ